MAGQPYSPHPWRTHGDRYIEAGDNLIVATVEDLGPAHREEQRANQRLLAASARLYETLKRLVDELWSDPSLLTPALLLRLDEAEGALARVEGRKAMQRTEVVAEVEGV